MANPKNVLILSNLFPDFGDPLYRLGTYKNYLLPYAKSLLASGRFDVQVLVPEAIGCALHSEGELASSDVPPVVVMDDEALSTCGLNDFMIRSCAEHFSIDQLALIGTAFHKSLGRWTPDVILCWEAPSKVLRYLFPNALTLDLMPGMFMRAPFPKMIQLDPCGLYGDAWYVGADVASIQMNQSEIDQVDQIRQLFLDHFEQIHTKSALQARYDISLTPGFQLVPLQISQYFGWKEYTDFETQFDFVESLLKNDASGKDLIFTQYVSPLRSDITLSDERIQRLEAEHPRFVFRKDFNEVDNISQYLVPHCSRVHSISSTVGLQALFFGKFLSSPSRSHLGYLASLPRHDAQKIVDFCLLRGSVLHDRLVEDAAYFAQVIDSFYAQKGKKGAAGLPSSEELQNSFSGIIKYSSFTTSERRIRAMLKDQFEFQPPWSQMNCKDHEIISFDVFDTLICRNVLRPAQVFDLMVSRMEGGALDVVPPAFKQRFSTLRQSFERLERQRLDAVDGGGEQEVNLLSIYDAILSFSGLSKSLAPDFLALEQEVELECLRRRPAGFNAYQTALRQRKRVILVSDFCHSREFVERALRSAGYDGWERVYVSSELGVRKHTGTMFKRVVSDLGVEPSAILHIGDNLKGDIERATACGISALWLPSAQQIAGSMLSRRRRNGGRIPDAHILQAILGAHINENVPVQLQRRPARIDATLISRPYDLGFLVLGPMLLSFVRWLYEDDKLSPSRKQFVFFARDMKVAYEIFVAGLGSELAANCATAHYIPVSRAALAGINLFAPEDLLSVRIDDFAKDRPVADLLVARFALEESEIIWEALPGVFGNCVEKSRVGDLSEGQIYALAVSSAREHWATISTRLEHKREMVRALLEQCGVDLAHPTVTVDFGYVGTIHRQISCLFQGEVLPRFFMEFSALVRNDELEGARSFFGSYLPASSRERTAFLKYNLILESLLNEPLGSVSGYFLNSDGVVSERRREISSTHARSIDEVHDGARKFAEIWRRYFGIVTDCFDTTIDHLDYFFELIMSDPSHQEAALLARLEFDNSFAGRQDRSILVRSPRDGKVIWPEGERALRRGPDYSPSNWRRFYTPLIRHFVRKLGSRRDLEIFDADPKLFFRSEVREFHYRILGRILYP
ncbi:HAD-IA family hydrolase [Roseibium aestuarii]|uniref:HAD-IA family hydrolase n=1 Tax=Roseibium aestuarii TaxID=2600299 RepID=A0ABW4JXZ9_9HYPH|nr:HAD-IA family hydrolase [Roseibium aestuarii]